ncbi:MAG: Gfo/Idh/MocA family oxidoreductase [Nitrososphaerota archaeon]
MIRLGLIGCGSVVKNSYVEAYREIMSKNPNIFEVAATCDADEERARSIAGQIALFQRGSSPRVYTDYKRMLETEPLDAVSVAVPHFAHHEVSIYALNAGLHVLVEKPFAITIKAGKKMIEAAERNGRVLACVHPVRRKVASRIIYWIVNKANLIGKPRFFFYQRVWNTMGVLVGTPWRYQKIKAGGGWVLDGEVHYVDFLRMVFGEVAEVYAKTRNFEPVRYLDSEKLANPVSSDVEDVAFATLTFESGLIGFLAWSNLAAGEANVIIKEPLLERYYGSEASIDYTGYGRNIPEKVEVRNKDGTRISNDELQKRFMESLSEEEKSRLFPLGITNFYAISFYDFLDSIINKRSPEVSGKEALASQTICEAIYESSVKGQPVNVKDVLDERIDTYQREINEYWKI